MAGCQTGGRGLQVRLEARQRLQKPQQVPLGLVEMELELGGDEGQEKSREMSSFSDHIKSCFLN